MRAFDVEYVRSQFPAFSDERLRGWAHFENAGGSYVCRRVIDRLAGFYRRTKFQPDYSFPFSVEAGAAMERSYELTAGWLGAGPDEIHFGPSTSQNTYVLARAFLSVLRPRDEIIASVQDHEANAGVWRRLEAAGAAVREWRVNPETGMLDLGEFDRMLNERTRLAVFPHASNVVAAVNPVAEICARAAAAGARTVVDGVSYAPHGLPDVGALGADVYLFSAYKTWGPHQGVMFVRRELAERLENQGHYFHAGQPRHMLTPAGPDHAQVAACAGVIEYLDGVYTHHGGLDGAAPAERARAVHNLFRAREAKLSAPLLEYLAGRSDVRLLGPADPVRRTPTVSILPLRRPVAEVESALVQRRMMVGAGDFYAPRLLEAMGVNPEPGALRMSFVHYTAPEEIDRLIEALDEALA